MSESTQTTSLLGNGNQNAGEGESSEPEFSSEAGLMVMFASSKFMARASRNRRYVRISWGSIVLKIGDEASVSAASLYFS